MAKTFKVKVKERRVIERAIERQIQKYGLVDTFAMKDSIKIAAGSRVALNKLYVQVVALYYYRFHDTFAADGKSTRNNIHPVDITIDAFQDPKVKEAIGVIYEQYTEWLINNFPLFGTAQMKDKPQIYVGFEFFGDGGKWDKAIAFSPLTS